MPIHTQVSSLQEQFNLFKTFYEKYFNELVHEKYASSPYDYYNIHNKDVGIYSVFLNASSPKMMHISLNVNLFHEENNVIFFKQSLTTNEIDKLSIIIKFQLKTIITSNSNVFSNLYDVLLLIQSNPIYINEFINIVSNNAVRLITQFNISDMPFFETNIQKSQYNDLSKKLYDLNIIYILFYHHQEFN